MPEVQDVFRLYGEDYLSRNSLPPHVCKAAHAIVDCRSAAMGGHKEVCDECGNLRISYNSCRNRSCPKCQSLAKEQWILDRESEMLPVPYFHVVFTLPEELNILVLRNRVEMFNILFKASTETLKALSLDGKHLGAETGFISILHTWGQNLTFHPHLHIVIPGGGLTETGMWRCSRKKFFIPVKVMAKMFRGKFMSALKATRNRIQGLEDESVWLTTSNALHSKDWYVYCKRPFKTNRSVLQYLGRYTHRIAISNQRILSIHDGRVSFKYRDYRDGSKQKVMSLSADEFIRRFLLHVLPRGFTKIRHFGFLGSAVKKEKLALCQKLTGATLIVKEKLSAADLMKKLTGKDITLCPCCGIGHFMFLSSLPPPKAA